MGIKERAPKQIILTNGKSVYLDHELYHFLVRAKDIQKTQKMALLKKIKKGDGFYFMPHFLVTFTRMKITKATMMKVIKATRKPPTPKS